MCPIQGSPTAMDPAQSLGRQPSCMAFTEPPRAHKTSLLLLDAPLDSQPCLYKFYTELKVGSLFFKKWNTFTVGPLLRLWLLSVKKLLTMVVVNIWRDSSSSKSVLILFDEKGWYFQLPHSHQHLAVHYEMIVTLPWEKSRLWVQNWKL